MWLRCIVAVKGAWTPDKVRQRIQTTMIVKRLEDHILGDAEMSKTQVAAAMGLLRKTLPDLCSVEHSGQLNVRRADEMTDAELAAIATGRSAGAAEQASGVSEPPELH
jgi:hypothetical protein